jgi:hypothetical protein
MARQAVLQPEIYPVPALRRRWFKNKIICEEGWSVAFSGSSLRIDRYDYYEEGKHLILGGEGAAGQMDIFLHQTLTWDDPPGAAMDEKTRERVLRNITVGLQWAGFSVGFFLLEEPETPAN